MGATAPAPVPEPAAPAPAPAAAPAPLTHDNDNHKPAANDNLPKQNTMGKILSAAAALASRGAVVYQGAKLVGRVLFDPSVFGDHNDYFADTPTQDQFESDLTKQGNADIKDSGQDPAQVRAQVREKIAQHRKDKADQDPAQKDNVKVNKNTKDRCDKLGKKIANQVKDLTGKRTEGLEQNPGSLPMYDPARTSPHADDVLGHQLKFRVEQSSLRKNMAEYKDKNCGPLPPGAEEASTMPVPKPIDPPMPVTPAPKPNLP